MPSGPSSPSTPPHSVLSRSSTRHLRRCMRGRPALRGEPVPEIGLQPRADRRPRKEPVAPVDPLAAGITPEEGGEIEHADIRACGRKGIQRGIVTRHGRTQGAAAALDRQHIGAGQREEVAHARRTDAVEHQPQAIDGGVGLADLRPDVAAHGQGCRPRRRPQPPHPGRRCRRSPSSAPLRSRRGARRWYSGKRTGRS